MPGPIWLVALNPYFMYTSENTQISRAGFYYYFWINCADCTDCPCSAVQCSADHATLLYAGRPNDSSNSCRDWAGGLLGLLACFLLEDDGSSGASPLAVACTKRKDLSD